MSNVLSSPNTGWEVIPGKCQQCKCFIHCPIPQFAKHDTVGKNLMLSEFLPPNSKWHHQFSRLKLKLLRCTVFVEPVLSPSSVGTPPSPTELHTVGKTICYMSTFLQLAISNKEQDPDLMKCPTCSLVKMKISPSVLFKPTPPVSTISAWHSLFSRKTN